MFFSLFDFLNYYFFQVYNITVYIYFDISRYNVAIYIKLSLSSGKELYKHLCFRSVSLVFLQRMYSVYLLYVLNKVCFNQISIYNPH